MKKSDNIVLIGFMGSGKSSVGKLLADKLGYSFRDADEMIESEEGTAIQKIFSIHGEEFFRNLETALLLTVKDDLEKAVLSTGGGMVLREKNRELLSMMGHVIYLQASSDTIMNRLTGDTTRPLLAGDNFRDRTETLLACRAPIYESAADIIINTDGKSIEEIAEEILGQM